MIVDNLVARLLSCWVTGLLVTQLLCHPVTQSLCHLKRVVLFGEVAGHAEEEGGDGVEVHVEVAAEADAVFEDGHVVPL